MGVMSDVRRFVNDELLPHLWSLDERPGATLRQISLRQAFSTVERTCMGA